MEDGVTSHKWDLSQIKMMIQVLINNKEHTNYIDSLHGPPKPTDTTIGGGS